MVENPRRAIFSSTASTVFATAGVAIGLGNIWRFPYMMGRYGGSVFLIAYLAILVAFAIPALMAEWALGRHTRRGPWGAFQQTGMPGGRVWSGLLLLTVTMGASYYGVVLAWVLYFAVRFLAAALSVGQPPDFSALTHNFGMQAAFTLATVAMGCAALSGGVRRGIEKVSKLALPVFFALFVILLIRVLTLKGATAALADFCAPHWENFTGATALAAMGQAFFSLGLGGTFMLTYGSYLRDEEDIPTSAVFTAVADAGAALMAGLIVVPATLVLGIPLGSGPPLLFQVMPEVFAKMPAGSWFAAAFFFSIFLVAMLSLMAAYETLVAAMEDARGWTRRRSLRTIGIVVSLLAIPAIVSVPYIGWSDRIWGNTMQPLGSIVAVVALAWSLGRGKALAQLRRSSRLPVPDWLFYWIKYGLPISAIVMLVYGWVSP